MDRKDAMDVRKLITDFLTEFFESFLSDLQQPSYHLDTIVRDLEECRIDCCILGGVALELYNYLRHTDDLDMLVSKRTFPKIAEYFRGNGYELRPGSRQNLYLTRSLVRVPIVVFVEGDVLGNHTLTNAADVRERYVRRWYATLPFLITSKLRAGGHHKRDVLLLIENYRLTDDFASKLEPEVTGRFLSMFLP